MILEKHILCDLGDSHKDCNQVHVFVQYMRDSGTVYKIFSFDLYIQLVVNHIVTFYRWYIHQI